MPLNTTLMDALVKKYGAKKAEQVYWGMVGEGKGPFAEGGKYHAEHVSWAAKQGVTPVRGGAKPRRRPKKR